MKSDRKAARCKQQYKRSCAAVGGLRSSGDVFSESIVMFTGTELSYSAIFFFGNSDFACRIEQVLRPGP
jgi:hypothetical protein